jgi:NAD-dependent SIR2 family protein deacetylase
VKGKDLFHASILNRPETSAVFYQFAAVLCRKILSLPQASATHGFIRVLADRNQLVRYYTQNIDALEEREGFSMEPDQDAIKEGEFWISRYGGSATREYLQAQMCDV